MKADEEEETGLEGGIGLFLAQELGQGGVPPPIVPGPPEVVEGQAGADLSLSEEEKKEELSPK